MKKIIFLCACILSSACLRADLKQDLSRLEKTLNTLADALRSKERPSSIFSIIPLVIEKTPDNAFLNQIFNTKAMEILQVDANWGQFERAMIFANKYIIALFEHIVNADPSKEFGAFEDLVAYVKFLKERGLLLQGALENLKGYEIQDPQKAQKIAAYLENIQRTIQQFYTWIIQVANKNFSTLQKFRFKYPNSVMSENAPAGDKFDEFVLTPIHMILDPAWGKNLINTLQESIKLWQEKMQGGGQPAGQIVPEITVPNIPGQVTSKQLAILLPDTQKIFRELATDMNNFISILGNFIKFTEGDVNPIAESRQLNDLAILLSQNFMDEKIYTLKGLIDKINQLRPRASATDAKIIFEFLADIHNEIEKFLLYLNEVYDTHKDAWERVTFVYKYPTAGYQQKGPASYHFYNVVLTRTAIGRLERMVAELRQLLPYWEKRTETKTQAAPTISFADVSNSDLRELLERANTDFDALKRNFNLFNNDLNIFNATLHAKPQETEKLAIEFEALVASVNTMQREIFELFAAAKEILFMYEDINRKEDAEKIVALLKEIRAIFEQIFKVVSDYDTANFNALSLSDIKYMYARTHAQKTGQLLTFYRDWILNNRGIQGININNNPETLKAFDAVIQNFENKIGKLS